MKNPKRKIGVENLNILKDSGIKTSRASIMRDYRRYKNENQEALWEGEKEMKVLNMKRLYKRKGWFFPPRQHHITTICHLLNEYYGKEVCKHIPKDELEIKLNK